MNKFFQAVDVDHKSEIVFRLIMVVVFGVAAGALIRGLGITYVIESSGMYWYLYAMIAVATLVFSHVKTIVAYKDRLFKAERCLMNTLMETMCHNGQITGIHTSQYSVNDGILTLDDSIRHASTRSSWMIVLSTAWFVIVIPEANTVYAVGMVAFGVIATLTFFKKLVRHITYKEVTA